MKAALIGMLLLSFQIPSTRFNQCTPKFTPDDHDFGTVQVGCSSRPMTFRLSATCPAFMTLSKPLNAQFVVTGVAPDHFTVQYVPTQYGVTESAIVAQVNHQQYAVTFRGSGDNRLVGDDVFADIGTRRVFYLTATPVLGTFAVSGAPDPWTYDAQQNAVVFASPPHGTYLTVTYRVACP